MAKEKEITPGSTIVLSPGKELKKAYKAKKHYTETLVNPGEDMGKDFLQMIIAQGFYDKWDENGGKVTDEELELDADTIGLLMEVTAPELMAEYAKLIWGVKE